MDIKKWLHWFPLILLLSTYSCKPKGENSEKEGVLLPDSTLSDKRAYNGLYEGEYLNRVAFPMGGIGAGMICLEGTGAISHVSVRNRPDVFNEPLMMAALSVKGVPNGTKVLEGPVPNWKIFGTPDAGNGGSGKLYGLPRFEKASFESRFPFGTVFLKDKDIPMEVKITGWSPFIPGDADQSSLPVAALEYHFKNTDTKPLEAAFSYHAENLMKIEIPSEWGGNYEKGHSIAGINNGFVLQQSCFPDKPYYKGDFAIFTDDNNALVDLCWFRGGWFDKQSILWKQLQDFTFQSDTTTTDSPGASIYVPFSLKPGEEKTVRVIMCWYVPHSDIRLGLPEVQLPGKDQESVPAATSSAKKTQGTTGSRNAADPSACLPGTECCADLSQYFYEPWYSGRFLNIREVINFWSSNYEVLYGKSELFSRVFYNMDLPEVIKEAVAANLTILKSPTVLRQKDGKLWAYEGCHDHSGCCPGSCTHVWNYAQSISRLFPSLERSLRETEFNVNQNEAGHQNFRAALPVNTPEHSMYAAADGQLGGIMKVYREWRLSGDTEWLRTLYPMVKKSLDYCIAEWDPEHKGIIEEPHHNTYDIEFWGPEGMCTGFYLGALTAMTSMGNALGETTDLYQELYQKGKKFMEKSLFNGEYFYQKIQWKGLKAADPSLNTGKSLSLNYSPEALRLLQKEGPKYQYGEGCLSDGVLGIWIGRMCGLNDFVNPAQVKSHLLSVYQYNFKSDLFDHVNPQRPTYAMGHEGGLLLCSWPRGNAPALPFVYSNEVWTGIEYQVASHLMLTGEVEKGLDIVRACRDRYDGRIRNPFDEYECGHWYARAMSSYGLLEGLTGVRYDAVDRILYIDSRIGDFTGFLSTETGYGNAGLKNGQPFLTMASGDIEVKKVMVSGTEAVLSKELMRR